MVMSENGFLVHFFISLVWQGTLILWSWSEPIFILNNLSCKSPAWSLTKSQDLRCLFNPSNQEKPAFPNQQKPTKKIDEFSTLGFAITRKRNDTAGWVRHRIAFEAPTWFTTLLSAVWSWFLKNWSHKQVRLVFYVNPMRSVKSAGHIIATNCSVYFMDVIRFMSFAKHNERGHKTSKVQEYFKLQIKSIYIVTSRFQQLHVYTFAMAPQQRQQHFFCHANLDTTIFL